MPINKTTKTTLSILLLNTACTAFAAGQGGYFGLMLGQSNLHGENQAVQAGTVPPTTISIKPDGTGVGTRLFAGYNMNQYAAIEGGFTYYSSMTYNTTVVSNNLKTRAASFDLLGKGMYNFSDTGFGVFAKLGGAYLGVKTSGSVQGVSVPTDSTSVFRAAGALGLSYELNQNWVADLSYSTIFYNSSTVKNPSLLALGISYHLLDPKCGQFLC